MQYQTDISWQDNGKDFNPKTYDRTHHIHFTGGLEFAASAAPEFLGNAKLPNPEELFIAAIASCFMLTFLYLAAMKGLHVASYKATSVGKLGKNEEGKMAMTEVTIKPEISFVTAAPDDKSLQELYHKAHDMCFISCSVKTKVTIA